MGPDGFVAGDARSCERKDVGDNRKSAGSGGGGRSPLLLLLLVERAAVLAKREGLEQDLWLRS